MVHSTLQGVNEVGIEECMLGTTENVKRLRIIIDILRDELFSFFLRCFLAFFPTEVNSC